MSTDNEEGAARAAAAAPLPEGEKLLTSAQLGALLQVSARTIWRMLKAGDLPAPIRFNQKMIRWRRSAVEAWLASR